MFLAVPASARGVEIVGDGDPLGMRGTVSRTLLLKDVFVDDGAALRALTAQYAVMENANDFARLGIRTCGGQSLFKTLPLEHLHRDSRCGSVMLPWTAEICLERIGREALYAPDETDD